MNHPLYLVRLETPDTIAAYWTAIILLCDLHQYDDRVTVYRRDDERRDGILSYSPTTILKVRAEHEAPEKAAAEKESR